jgi:protein phosphatase
VRLNWAADYSAATAIVYGHTPVVEPVWLNNTVDIDTGCVFGGALTAVRWPERTFVSVPARRAYAAKGGPWRLVGPGGEIAVGDAAPTPTLRTG